MKLRLVRSLWGVEEPWETVIPKFKQLGYYAVETPVGIFSENERNLLKKLLNENDLKLVCQIHTDPYYSPPGKRNKNVNDHIKSFHNQVIIGKEFDTIFYNSHSGYDGWKETERNEFFEKALKIEKDEGVIIAHETHRRRILYNPWTTRDVLEKFPNLKITADFSHWFCVCHDVLDSEMDIIELTAKHTIHIHARVGYSQGPQVPDPRAPEWMPWVEAHERCWDKIWKIQSEKNTEFSYIEPEFGPKPYMPTLPYTDMPVSNLWDICEWQTKRQTELFNKLYGS